MMTFDPMQQIPRKFSGYVEQKQGVAQHVKIRALKVKSAVVCTGARQGLAGNRGIKMHGNMATGLNKRSLTENILTTL